MQSLSGMSSFDRFLLGDSRRRSADICAFNVYGEGYTDTDMFNISGWKPEFEEIGHK